MRVIAGKYKNTKIVAPSGDNTRPTTDRIKETVFNIIQFRIGGKVLDLFAGTGGLGIEALSRGAKSAVFIDKNRDAIQCIKKNTAQIEEKIEIVQTDFLAYLKYANEPFDLIFIDAPYMEGIGELAVNAILDLNLLSKQGIIIFEHSVSCPFKLARVGFKTREKVMGTVVVDFITHKTTAVFAGSFDPITKGHKLIAESALKNFDEVIVLLAVNDQKQTMFSYEQRLELLQMTFADTKGIVVDSTKGLVADYAKSVGANCLVRGIRNDDDLRYENEIKEFNLTQGIDTEYITLDEFNDISSTSVRSEIALDNFKNVPVETIFAIREMLSGK